MKRYKNDINVISYNKKDMVQETWKSLKDINADKKEEPESESDTESEPESYVVKGFDDVIPECDREKLFGKIPMKSRLINISESESELDTDSDTEEEIPDVINIEITIKNKPNVVKGSNVYDKTSGEFYGTYVNGKVKRKIKQTDIDV